MSRKNQNLESIIIKSLKANGFIVPTSEDEVQAFEEALEKQKLPPIPPELDTPDKILARGFSNPNKIISMKDQEAANNLARAAREGKSISQSVLDKMKKDRGNAEKTE